MPLSDQNYDHLREFDLAGLAEDPLFAEPPPEPPDYIID